MNIRDQAYRFSKQQIRQDKRNTKVINKIVDENSKEFMQWWALFQSVYPEYDNTTNSQIPNHELVNMLDMYAIQHGLQPANVSNVDQLLDYASTVYSSVIASESITKINKSLHTDVSQTADLGQKIYKHVAEQLTDEEIKRSYDGRKWSDNVWSNQAQLRNDVSKAMRQAMLSGNNPMSYAKDLRKKFGVFKYQAERILRTEGARVSGKQQMRNIKASGFDYAEWVASAGACRYCMEMDGKRFKVSKYGSDPYVLPKHHNCRCAVVAADNPDDIIDG
ncbi:minor capsid protein [Eupransor demetentiae]|uniref:Contains phage Mu head morphogenesis gpF-like domain n=1 Tax=Eupransor demetentiae TaxID=3109584 RepID=A0ABM9N4T2_9LACO|nr:Uncharacterized protein R54876_GBNLAHCA_00686 [Lactobacillaceae bacterium LMG 33000]